MMAFLRRPLAYSFPRLAKVDGITRVIGSAMQNSVWGAGPRCAGARTVVLWCPKMLG